MNSGRLRMTPVGVDAIAGEHVVAGVIKDARRRQRRRRLTAAGLTCAGIAVGAAFFPSGGGRKLSGQPGGIGSPTAPISGRVVGSAGVSVRLPESWVAKSMVLPQGGGHGLAWLQATNFATAHLVGAEDPLKELRAGQVAITISDRSPETARVRSQGDSRLSVSHAVLLPPAQTPHRHLVLELTPTIRGRALVINIDFGSRSTKAQMAPVVDGVLQTLSVGPSRASPVKGGHDDRAD